MCCVLIVSFLSSSAFPLGFRQRLSKNLIATGNGAEPPALQDSRFSLGVSQKRWREEITWRIAEVLAHCGSAGAARKHLARRGHFELKRKNYALEYQLERL